MFTRGKNEWWWYLGLGVAGVVALKYAYEQVTGVNLIDVIGDNLVTLTSSEDQRIAELVPDAGAALYGLIQNLSAAGISVHVGQTLRTQAEEKAAIDCGHSAVTTHSWHEIGRAVDLYPINPDTGQPDLDGVRDDLFQAMVAAARQLGWTSLAYESDGVTRHYLHLKSGKRIWDGGHLEWHSPYGSIAEAVDAEGANFGIA